MRSDDASPEKNRQLVAAVLAGKSDAIARFLQEISPTIWASCRAVSAYEGEARDGFIAIIAELRTTGFAAFREYDGRSTLTTFTALVVRELHCLRLVQLLVADSAKAWRLFERIFEADIRRMIDRRVSSSTPEDLRRDIYQAVCLALVEQDYRRIRAYDGRGSFGGFALRCIGNIIHDEIRRSIAPRRRNPAGLHRHQAPTGVAWDPDASVIATSPEERMIQIGLDEELSAALTALSRAVRGLSDDERLYVNLVLMENPPPPRELARIMRRPVGEIYALKQRVLRKLREHIADHSAVKTWLASV